MSRGRKRILVSAGELSGDQHLAKVISAIRELSPSTEFRGMAGDLSAAAGASLDLNCYRDGAGMGFFELFRSGARVLRSFRVLSGLLSSWRPDLLILVDYPDFNLRLAKVAKRFGVRVVYYIPPKVWAWRKGRVRKIRLYVDRVIGIFPFEGEFYRRNGYTAFTYLGHPLGDRATDLQIPSASERSNAVLFLPGSRRFEVERLLVPMLHAYQILKARRSDLQAIVVLAPSIDPDWVKGIIGDRVPAELISSVEWSQEDALSQMLRARAGVLKSGTCNLEGAIAGLPFVCVYSGTLFAKIVVATLVALKEFSPVNIIRANTVRELIQTALSPQDVVAELEPLLFNHEGSWDHMADNLATVRRMLCEPSVDLSNDSGLVDWERLSVSQRVAWCILSELGYGAPSCVSNQPATGHN